MLVTCLVTQCRLTPWSNRTLTSDRSSAFTTAVWVVVRVHYGTSYGRSPTHVSLTSSLTNLDVSMLDVSNFADGSSAVDSYHTNFAGWQSNLCIVTFLRHQLSTVTGRSYHLSTLARFSSMLWIMVLTGMLAIGSAFQP